MRYKLLLLLLICFSANAQKSKEYVGALKLNDSTAIPYRIIFEEKKGKLFGYSITDFGGDHETKSNIVGSFDSDKKLISFYEKGIVYTKSSFVKNDFCYVHVEPTKFKLGKTKSIKANFFGKFSDGSKCIDGELYLNALERVQKILNKVTKKVNKSKRVDDSLKTQFNNIKVMDSIQLNILRKSQTTSYFTKKKKIELVFYDGGRIDNDIITVMKNDSIVLKEFQISDHPKIINVLLDKGTTNISIIANSIGTIGENTTVVEIRDGINNIKAMTNLAKGDKTNINFILKK